MLFWVIIFAVKCTVSIIVAESADLTYEVYGACDTMLDRHYIMHKHYKHCCCLRDIEQTNGMLYFTCWNPTTDSLLPRNTGNQSQHHGLCCRVQDIPCAFPPSNISPPLNFPAWTISIPTCYFLRLLKRKFENWH